jgi:hypothetical protein
MTLPDNKRDSIIVIAFFVAIIVLGVAIDMLM